MGFQKAIEEISFELSKISLFNTFLNSAIVFMVAYLILGIFSFYPLFFSMILALLYFIISLLLKARENSIIKVESKYSALKEKLRTAADNIKLSNPIVAELQEDIAKDLSRVEDAAFFNEKNTYTKILMVLLLSFVIVFTAPISIDIIKPEIKLSDIQSLIREKGGGAGVERGGKGAGLGPSSGDIYGIKSVAKIGTEELKIEIKHIGYEINLRSVQNIEEREFEESFPSEVYAEAGESFEENIPKEEQEIVKNYFKAIAESQS